MPRRLFGPTVCLVLFFVAAAFVYIETHLSLVDEGRDIEVVDRPLQMAPGRAGSTSNATLGFEKILVINLPERTDKRDAMTLSASLSGLKIDWISAVRGSTLPDVALPFGAGRNEGSGLSDGNIGSWRSHMNAVRSIVENGYSSALILEDDVDWDIRIKTQMAQFARGVRFLLPDPESTAPSESPYGDGWDLLWIGHCGESLRPEGDRRTYVIYDDPTVPDFNHVSEPDFNLTDWPEYTRLVHHSWGPICSFAYALSYSGAQKLLYHLGVNELTAPYDNALALMCRYLTLDMKCISATPEYMFHHRARGLKSKDSDIQDVRDDNNIREKGYSKNIVWSMRRNLKQQILGTKPELQWDE
ncbi:MAG: hypothetical protein M1825_006054 [Sarcosagium campestre]|nr:MAG: hypothetical protein M1825_006054 [Sarcosagium campestre]